MEPNPSQYEELYRAVVGEKKLGYYLPLFQRFDQPNASFVSWNWPAFFVSFFWLLYRRMYLPALAYFFLWPFTVLVLMSIVSVMAGPAVAAILGWSTQLLGAFVVFPMFANALYHWHVRRRIAKMALTAPSHAALVERLIGSASGGAPIIVAIACVIGVTWFGILAAIAIPAYQDYTIRAQVAEVLNQSTPIKASVAQSYGASGSWPADLSSAGLEEADYTGRFVSGIEVSDGTILIRFGNAANPRIAGHTLSLHPTAAEDGSIEWSCGYAAGSDAATDIPQQYLPRLCRDATGQVERL
ncbi:MAG TPA: pilin [Steroidobacteraceae bacterium]|jgi:hypothetical protein